MARLIAIVSTFSALVLLVAMIPESPVSAANSTNYPANAPVVTAALVCVDCKDEKGGTFRVEFGCSSDGDENLLVTGVIQTPSPEGLEVKLTERSDIEIKLDLNKGKLEIKAPEPNNMLYQLNESGGFVVENEQMTHVKLKNDQNKFRFKVKNDDNLLKIEATSVRLLVTCFDSQGNVVGTASAEPGSAEVPPAGGESPASDEPPAGDDLSPSGVWRPAPGTSWQWQLDGTIDTSIDVQMYDIDLFDAPREAIDELHADGRVVICYFSAGSWEDWRPDASQFPDSVKGKSNGWPGEKWLDIRQIDVLGPIMEARLDLAAEKNCDGVEPDNVDGYTNDTGFPLSSQDQSDFLVWLANVAHGRSLSIGLKNDLEQVDQLVSTFDWALNEQCFQYDECELLLPFVNSGKAVFGVEYSGSVSSFCQKANALNFDWLQKREDLDSWRVACR